MKIHGTAKGAALSMKDFGVAFGGGISPETQYCQPLYDESIPVGTWYGGGSREGVQFKTGHTLIGVSATKATVHSKLVGSPTGTMYFRIFNTSGTLQFEFGSKDVEELTEEVVSYQFNSGSSYTIQADDILALDFTGGDASNYVTTTKQNATGYTNEEFVDYDGSAFRYQATKGNSYCVTYLE